MFFFKINYPKLKNVINDITNCENQIYEKVITTKECIW